jgi:putative nucleotidyltransferase with HDIG domain
VAKPVVIETSYAEKVRKSEVFMEFHKEFDDTVSLMQSVLSDFAKEEVTVDAVHQVVDEAIQILGDAHGDVNVFDMLHNMRQNSDLTYAHSINVALICHVIARWIGMTEEQITLAFTCGILHDIGKLRMPAELINKTGKLTKEEFDKLKTHPIEGYNMLKSLPIDKHIKNAALMHHERLDGSGYPIGMHGDEIDKYARIVAIADVYEAATAPRVYRKGLSPFEVFEMFEKEGIQKYDTQMIMTFMEKLADTYMLNRVRLSNGMIGKIVFINKQTVSRPVVKCGETFVDLSKEPDITIAEII